MPLTYTVVHAISIIPLITQRHAPSYEIQPGMMWVSRSTWVAGSYMGTVHHDRRLGYFIRKHRSGSVCRSDITELQDDDRFN
jgi:hypothetical protein